MPLFDAQLQWTLILNATITVTAENEDHVHDVVREMIENGDFGRIEWNVLEASRHPDWEEDTNKMAGDDISIDSVYRT